MTEQPIEDWIHYHVRYYDHTGVKYSVCVTADHVTEAIEMAMAIVPALKTRPNRIFSVARVPSC